MKILALDTATEMCSVALSVGGQILSEHHFVVRQHAQLILPMIERLLAVAQLSMVQLDAIAFGCGPGSFTGLRIAAGVVQGLSLPYEIPIIGVSSLQTLAQGARREFACDRVLCALDARMQEVYWASYRYAAGCMQLEGVEQVIAPQHVVIPTTNAWCGIGTGWQSYAKMFPKELWSQLYKVVPEGYPLAQDMLVVALKSFSEGKFLTPEQAVPVYLRNKVTQSIINE